MTYLNRLWAEKKDPKDGSYTQQVTNGWYTKNSENLGKMKKMKLHKGLRGQNNISTGRRGKTVGFQELKHKK